jgi:hypothetical protein
LVTPISAIENAFSYRVRTCILLVDSIVSIEEKRNAHTIETLDNKIKRIIDSYDGKSIEHVNDR